MALTEKTLVDKVKLVESNQIEYLMERYKNMPRFTNLASIPGNIISLTLLICF